MPTPALSQQPIAEDRAFANARAVNAHEDRVSALQEYLQRFPSGSHREAAQRLLLDTLLDQSPVNNDRVHQTASALFMSADPGFERWLEGCRLADTLANTGPSGADLDDAQKWSEAGVQNFRETSYRTSMMALGRRSKLPPLTPKQMHTQFAHDRAVCLLALTNVDIRLQHEDAAKRLLQEATQLDPQAAELPMLSGELALKRGDESAALDDFIRANAAQPLPPAWRQRELELFRTLRRGDESALEAAIDAAYRERFPTPYALAKRDLPAGGHPVLLELFTGSDCLPCAGPDLALESLLGTYGRKDLVALEYGVHIPHPDPLATPEALELAAAYGVDSTPTALLDGESLQILGGSRADVENIVIGFADQIESVAALRSGVALKLDVNADATGVVEASVALAPEALGRIPRDETTGDASLSTLSRAVVHIALVQDTVRYAGKNGVRLHRMVVRALQERPASTALGHRLEVRFDLRGLEAAHTAYLLQYQTSNDRFGSFRFRQTDFPLPKDGLTVVAWVQNPRTHEVLNTASATCYAQPQP